MIKKNIPIDIPVVGAGSQPPEKDFDFMEMPVGMHTFNMPNTNLESDPVALSGTIAVLNELCQKISADDFVKRIDQNQIRINLGNYSAEVILLLDETLGNGEVSIIIEDDNRRYEIQESVFTGLWREITLEKNSENKMQIIADALVVGAIPEIAVKFALAQGEQISQLPTPPTNIMNAPAIISEIKDVSNEFHKKITANEENLQTHIINLSLLPVTPEDLQYINDFLGKGNVAILSRGFGNCQINATAYKNIWWVRYFNNSGKMILNSIEITKIPEMALAAKEDFAATLERLSEWVKVITPAG